MSVINVTVTNAGAANVSVSNGSTVNATVGNGGAVNVSTGTISPGNATVVSGTLTINSTTTLAAGQAAYVKNDAGTAFAAKLDIGIPAGPATNVVVGNTTTLAAGSNATVSGTANGSTLTLAFGVPAGTPGTNGTNGITPTFSASATTLSAGSDATVTATTSNGGANVALAFGIPQGAAGSGGGSGATLSDATPSNLGTAAAGSSNLAARADHTHNLPSLSTLGAAAAAHNHPYVTSLNNLTGGLTLAAGGNVTITPGNSTLTIAASGGLGENDAVDGGNYVGEIPSIIFSLNPQNQTVNLPISVTFGSTSSITHNLANTFSRLGVAGSSILTMSPQSPYAGLGLSNDNGATWSRLQSLAFCGDRPGFAVADNGTRFVVTTGTVVVNFDNTTSVDEPRGTTYYGSSANTSALTAASIEGLGHVVWSPTAGMFAAAVPGRATVYTDANGAIYTSADGVSWTQRATLPATFNGGNTNETDYSLVRASFLLNGKIVFFGGKKEARIIRSANGISWETPSISGLPPKSDLQGALQQSLNPVSDGTRAVQLLHYGDSGPANLAAWTSDGAAWQQVALPINASSLSCGKGLFFAWAGNQVATSPDGQSWTLRTLPGNSPTAAIGIPQSNDVLFINGPAGSRFTGSVASTFGSANLTVNATLVGGNPISYQWQRSTDAGSSWLNVAAATSTNISVTNITAGDNGTRYRALASANGATSVASQSATLTVTG
jgi:hypothetical protein